MGTCPVIAAYARAIEPLIGGVDIDGSEPDHGPHIPHFAVHPDVAGLRRDRAGLFADAAVRQILPAVLRSTGDARDRADADWLASSDPLYSLIVGAGRPYPGLEAARCDAVVDRARFCPHRRAALRVAVAISWYTYWVLRDPCGDWCGRSADSATAAAGAVVEACALLPDHREQFLSIARDALRRAITLAE